MDSCDGFSSPFLLITSDIPMALPTTTRKTTLPKVVTSSTLKAMWLRWFPSHLADASNKPLNLIP